MMCQVGEERWKVNTVVVALQDHEREVTHCSFLEWSKSVLIDTMNMELVTKPYLKHIQWKKITPELTVWCFNIFFDFTSFKYE